MLAFFRRRCRLCGKTPSVIMHEHEREHVAELVREGQAVLDELRTALQGAQQLAAVLQAMKHAETEAPSGESPGSASPAAPPPDPPPPPAPMRPLRPDHIREGGRPPSMTSPRQDGSAK